MNPASLQPRRAQFWLAAAIFLGPLLAAFVIYRWFPGLMPSGRTNYGELVNPPRPLPLMTFAGAEDQPVQSSTLRGKWSLIYLGAASCADNCRERLHLARQLRLALNEKRVKLQRVYLAPDAAALTAVRTALAAEHPDLVWLTAALADPAIRQFFRAADREALYLLDPWGNWVMTYPFAPGVEAEQRDFKGMQKDLKKLLKL